MRGAWHQTLIPVLALLMVGVGADAQTICTAAPKLSVAVAEGALLTVTLDAPCQKGARATLSHAGFRFTVRLDDHGHYLAVLPALDAAGQVTAAFAEGGVLTAAQSVPDLGDQRRLALQRPKTMRISAKGTARLTFLGDAGLPDPLLVQIVDLDPPAGADGDATSLLLIADVTPESCNHDLMVRTLVIRAKAAPQSDAILLSMPACGADTAGAHLSLDLGAAIQIPAAQ